MSFEGILIKLVLVVNARLPMKTCVFFASVIKALPAQLLGCGAESIMCRVLCKEKTPSTPALREKELADFAEFEM